VVVGGKTILLLRKELVDRRLLARRGGDGKGDVTKLQGGINRALVIARLRLGMNASWQSNHLAGVDGAGDAVGLGGEA
jgi:hypothetical protein